MQPPAQEPGTARTPLARAAQSIAAVSGVAETVVDVLHGRALRHYAKGLRQYTATRLGSLDEADAALTELRAIIAAQSAEDLVSPPGIRARLYRITRQITERKSGGQPPPTETFDSLPWVEPRSESARTAFTRLRHEIKFDERELLELRYTRELSEEEIAFVLDASADDVGFRLDAAFERARSLLKVVEEVERISTEAALLEAFALDTGADPAATPQDGEQWAALPEGTVLGGRYEVQTRVGSGAFADVYQAKDTEVPGHVVALKLLHQASLSNEAKNAALRELHLIASVFHPSIVQFKDHGWHEGRLWFVMPWYDGEPLETLISQRPLTRVEARRIFAPLARALAVMHVAGIRHQDVKPDNIFLARIRGFGYDSGRGEVLPVLLDLGVAAKEAEMVVAGTPTYFAPEVAAQFAAIAVKHPITPKADVFSLALSLRNALEPSTQEDVTGGAVETFIEHRATHPPPFPVSRELRYLKPYFARWMSLEPDERPSAEQFAEELEVLTRPEERRRRVGAVMRWLAPLVVALVAVFGSVIYVLSARAEREKLQAADLRADLTVSREQKRELEENVNELRERYEAGQLTRQQLADRLATTQRDIRRMRQDLIGSERRRRVLDNTLKQARDELTHTQADLDQTRAELGQAQSELSIARRDLGQTRMLLGEARVDLERVRSEFAASQNHLASLQSELASARAQVLEAERQGEEARNRAASLEQQVSSLTQQIAAEKTHSERHDDALSTATAERDRARADVTRLEAEVAEARRRIEELERR